MDYGDLSHTRLLTELMYKHSLEFEFKEGRVTDWQKVYDEFRIATGLDFSTAADIVDQYMNEIDVGDTW